MNKHTFLAVAMALTMTNICAFTGESKGNPKYGNPLHELDIDKSRSGSREHTPIVMFSEDEAQTSNRGSKSNKGKIKKIFITPKGNIEYLHQKHKEEKEKHKEKHEDMVVFEFYSI